MGFAKTLSMELIGSKVQPYASLISADQRFINALVAAGKGIQLDTWVAREPTVAALCSKFYAAVVSLGSNGSQTLALSGLTSAVQSGDLVLGGVFAVEIFNNEPLASRHTLVVGNDGTAAEFFEFIGVATGVTWIPPQCRRIFTTRLAGGWVTTSHDKLKLASGGAYPVEAHIAMGGL